ETAHTTKLTDLLPRTTGTGVHHHVDRVEALLILFELLHEGIGQQRVRTSPDIDYLVVALVVCDQTHHVVVPNCINFFLSSGNKFTFLSRDLHIIETHRETTLVRHLESKVFDIIEELRSLRQTCKFEDIRDDGLQFLLRQQFVNESDFFRHILVEQHTSYNSVDQLHAELAGEFIPDFYPYLNKGMLGNPAFIVGNDYFLCRVKLLPFTRNGELRSIFSSF